MATTHISPLTHRPASNLYRFDRLRLAIGLMAPFGALLFLALR